MEFIKGQTKKKALDISEIREMVTKALSKNLGSTKELEQVSVNGVIHRIREMSDFAFVVLRTRRDLLQCVYSKENSSFDLKDIAEGDAVTVIGEAVPDQRASLGFEIHMHDVDIKSRPAEASPVTINKKALDVSLDTNLQHRPISLRNPKERAIFKIQEGIARGFREYLLGEEFTEVRTPKIVFAGAEGGSNVFKMDYFGKQVYLAQSPQFYKQMGVGVFERVFEVAPVYRAEKHNTSRHLNEYTSMDLEMGFIEDFQEIMNLETNLIRSIFDMLKSEYSKELDLLNVKLPGVESIPAVKFTEAKEIVSKVFNRKIKDVNDLEPEEEQLICDYAKKEYNSPFIFITHYPEKKRPFYAMEDKNDPGYTLSFDLLFNGAEITTGGQRIHDYNEQVEKMLRRGMDVNDFESYLKMHKHGMPPHGGLGIGLERFTAKLLGLQNIRSASMFPRDITRVTP